MKLTDHFTLEEMTVSVSAPRLGIENTPSSHALGNLLRLCTFLEQVRSLVGGPVLISSGYRSPALNGAVGGSTNSAHCKGLAADFIVPNLTPKQLAQAIADSPLEFDQLILEYDKWVHLALADGPLRREILTIRKGTGYLSGLV
ncbi:D-Ala-D-Ala carboxypeptidase family metallohydrolase [Pseudomonas alkylphenolica]|uniref:D-Ala-D-Ala carboxypeptidase family metallohydrolase n=1 Tax=Pseudomonas alkylphenolica TaxID=237609 RepID=UPI0018D9CC1F|nr:D-Ala-D-Ala carboxypeptidase family metallohydrolase [Pseudomonas alkylphenolica]MBH3427362.1 peptidase M15 [Pseudomonas alkylphenolica]